MLIKTLRLNSDKCLKDFYTNLGMEGNCQCKGKSIMPNKPLNTSHCEFLHLDLENKKVPPYLGDI